MSPPRDQDLLRPGDLLLRRVHANINEVATAALVAAVPHGLFVCHSSMIRLRPRSALLSPEILLAWLHHAPIRSIIVAAARHSLKASINHDGLLSLPCPFIPDAEERAAISAELARLTQAIYVAHNRVALIEAAGHDAGV